MTISFYIGKHYSKLNPRPSVLTTVQTITGIAVKQNMVTLRNTPLACNIMTNYSSRSMISYWYLTSKPSFSGNSDLSN